jgi:hypothetical protein
VAFVAAGCATGVITLAVNTTCAARFSSLQIATASQGANGASVNPTLTPDGRFVAFESEATNLVGGCSAGTRKDHAAVRGVDEADW